MNDHMTPISIISWLEARQIEAILRGAGFLTRILSASPSHVVKVAGAEQFIFDVTSCDDAPGSSGEQGKGQVAIWYEPRRGIFTGDFLQCDHDGDC